MCLAKVYLRGCKTNSNTLEQSSDTKDKKPTNKTTVTVRKNNSHIFDM